MLQPSATIQPAAPSARKQQAILIPKVPGIYGVDARTAITIAGRLARQTVPVRMEPDPPARPNRGATLFYIGNTRHTHARGEDIPVSHQDTHSSPAAEGWSPRPPRHLPPIAAPRAAPGSLAPDGSHRAGRRRPHAGRDRSDWCRPRAPKNQPRRKQAARNNARSSIRHLSDLRSPSGNKVTPPS